MHFQEWPSPENPYKGCRRKMGSFSGFLNVGKKTFPQVTRIRGSTFFQRDEHWENPGLSFLVDGWTKTPNKSYKSIKNP